MPDFPGLVAFDQRAANVKWLAPTTVRGQPKRTRDELRIELINGAPNQILGAN